MMNVRIDFEIGQSVDNREVSKLGAWQLNIINQKDLISLPVYYKEIFVMH